MTEAIWDQTVNTDLKGPFFLAKLAALQMIKAGRGGRIINLLSTESGQCGHPRCDDDRRAHCGDAVERHEGAV